MDSKRVGDPVDTRFKVLSDDESSEIARQMEEDGYAIIRSAIDPDYCAAFGSEVVTEYQRLVDAGWKFAAGGRLTGHLAFKPSVHGPRILSMLRQGGYVAAAERYARSTLEADAFAGNMNMPGSRTQEIHQDLYGDSSPHGDPIVFNVLLTETTPAGGATDIVPGSQTDTYRSLHSSGALRRGAKFVGSPGDLLVRRSAVWHRGPTNKLDVPRPMFGVIMRPTDRPAREDPPCDGPIEFYGNRFYGRFALLREVAAVYGAPLLHAKRQLESRVRK